MADAYERAKGGRLTFKGGALATRSSSIDKKHKKKHKKPKAHHPLDQDPSAAAAAGGDEDSGEAATVAAGGEGGDDIYTIDAAKRMKYEQLFPFEAKKFGYDPKASASRKSVEEALDDRVMKKADRYCK